MCVLVDTLAIEIIVKVKPVFVRCSHHLQGVRRGKMLAQGILTSGCRGRFLILLTLFFCYISFSKIKSMVCVCPVPRWVVGIQPTYRQPSLALLLMIVR